MKVLSDLKSYTLSSEQIESLLMNEYGGKLQPVDNVMLAKQRQQKEHREATYQAYKNRFQKPKVEVVEAEAPVEDEVALAAEVEAEAPVGE